MERRFPYYYRLFRCSADKCSDSCCMHWEIDIDDESLEKYRNWPGDFGKRLKESIYINEEGGHFKMDSRERCLFLNEQGLCDMILAIGEEHLCEICREHPRFYDCFSFGEEMGVGLCCEEAARLILDSGISDEIISEGEPDDLSCDAEERLLFQERNQLLTDDSLINEILERSSWSDVFFTEETLCRLTELMLGLEIESDKWRLFLERLKADPKSVLSEKESFLTENQEVKEEYRRLLDYFIYRYFMEARFYEDPEYGSGLKLQFAFISVGIIMLADILEWKEKGKFTREDQIDICKMYSQEIEYDPDNVEKMENFIF